MTETGQESRDKSREYEIELTRLKGLVREMGEELESVATASKLRHGYLQTSWTITLYTKNKAKEILSRPEVRAILEEK